MSVRGIHTRPDARSAHRRRLAAWLGVVALALQGLIPLGQAVPLGKSADGPRTLVVCSTYGTRTVTVPGGPGAPTGADRTACGVCMAYACGGGLALPPVVLLPFPPAGGDRRIDQPAPVAQPMQVPGLPRPRGPPAMA